MRARCRGQHTHESSPAHAHVPGDLLLGSVAMVTRSAWGLVGFHPKTFTKNRSPATGTAAWALVAGVSSSVGRCSARLLQLPLQLGDALFQ